MDKPKQGLKQYLKHRLRKVENYTNIVVLLFNHELYWSQSNILIHKNKVKKKKRRYFQESFIGQWVLPIDTNIWVA